jgi:hypothetical protein
MFSDERAQRQAQPSRRMLRTRGAAAYLNLSASTLNKRRLTGDGLVFTKQGHIVTYDIADLDAYIDARKRTSTSQYPPARKPPPAASEE